MIAIVFLLTGCGAGETDAGMTPDEDFLIVAHRGASAYAPENTLESYELAEDMNADYIELDIQLTEDGEIVVIHDNDVSETTDGTGDIGNYTLSELKTLTANQQHEEGEKVESKPSEDYRVPTLREVFEQFGERIHFMIELKESKNNKGIEEKLVDLLVEYDMIPTDKDKQPKVYVHSFHEKGLKRVHELNDEIPLLKLVTFEEDETPELSEEEIDDLKSYTTAIGVGYKNLDKDFINEMNEQGLIVYATAVQDAKVARTMEKIGAKGIFTDYPDLMGYESE